MIRRVQDADYNYDKVMCDNHEKEYLCTVCKIRFLCYTTNIHEIILLKSGDYIDFLNFVNDYRIGRKW